MKGLVTVQRYFARKLKSIPRQSWVVRPDDAYIPFNQRDLSNLNIQHHKKISKQPPKSPTQQQPASQPQPPHSEYKPLSPRMGPYTVHNPRIYNKTYRWCSCGQSLNQPFCDDSHQGTQFKPYKFTIQQNVKEVELCGCKLTSRRPFCDGVGCRGGCAGETANGNTNLNSNSNSNSNNKQQK